MASTKCWICGNSADSREHKVKRSDLKSIAGNFSQSNPIYMQTINRKNKKIGSLDAKALKYETSLCKSCNNTATQSHDLAWQHLTETLRFRKPTITAGQWIRANKVFSYDTKHAMRHAHLYVVKQFGCMLVEGGVKEIDLNLFSNAILKDKIHPNVYIAFGPAPLGKDKEKVIAGSSDLEMDTMKGQCLFAAYIHHIGNLWVRVMYAIDGENRQGLIRSWNPRFGSKRLFMDSFGK